MPQISVPVSEKLLKKINIYCKIVDKKQKELIPEILDREIPDYDLSEKKK